jgi:hypothetical protein
MKEKTKDESLQDILKELVTVINKRYKESGNQDTQDKILIFHN